MARDTIRQLAEDAADRAGVPPPHRSYFIDGYVAGQRDALAEVARRARK